MAERLPEDARLTGRFDEALVYAAQAHREQARQDTHITHVGDLRQAGPPSVERRPEETRSHMTLKKDDEPPDLRDVASRRIVRARARAAEARA